MALMVYPSDDRHLRARILAQRSREIRRLAASGKADAAEVIRVITELVREAETLVREGRSAAGEPWRGPKRLPPEGAGR